MAQIDLSPVSPAEALRYFRGKGLQESFDYRDISPEEHARSFTVAKGMSHDILRDIRAGIDRAIDDGTGLETFRQELTPLLQAKGWWGRQPLVDPHTDELKLVQLGSPERLRTIFDVNMRVAYQAGRWERIQRTKSVFPFLRYVATLDDRTRPEHRAWHGTIRRVDDPWWDTHYPPCGWRCRCTVVQLTERMMRQRGWSVTEAPPTFPKRTYTNKRTGQTVQIEGGIDPSWNHNVGKHYLDGLSPTPAGPMRDAPDKGRVARAQPPLGTRLGPAPGSLDASQAALQEQFLRAFGATADKAVVFTDAGGHPFVASGALFRDLAGDPAPMTESAVRALPLAARAIRWPEEIREVWSGPKGDLRLMRRYLARVQDVAGDIHEVAVDIGGGTWAIRSSLDSDFDLASLRVGELNWRRVSAEGAGMSQAEQAAIRFYTSEGFEAINTALREGRAGGVVVDHIAALDTLFTRNRLDRDLVVHRRFSKAGVDWLVAQGLGPGDVIQDEAFFSSSRDPMVTARFGDFDEGAIHLVILARKGVPAFDVSTWSEFSSEHEILFARRTRFKLIGWDHDTRILSVETID